MKAYFHSFVLQLSRYIKMINWCWFTFKNTFQACKKAYFHAFMFLWHDSWPEQNWVSKCEMLCFYMSQKNKSKHVFQGVLSYNKNRFRQFCIIHVIPHFYAPWITSLNLIHFLICSTLCTTLFSTSLDYKFELV